MPRSVRIEFTGARYHVMSRGNRREFVLGTDEDKTLFLKTLGETCERTGWLVHSYVVMDNHFHLLLETPEANLSEGMRWLQGTFGTRYNLRHGLVGHVWQGRFKSPIISDEGDSHFLSVSRYIHLNPARAGLLDAKNPRLSDYSWSSYPGLCSSARSRPSWLVADTLYGCYQFDESLPAHRRKYRNRMERTCRECLTGKLEEEIETSRRQLERGWCIGDSSFKDRMKDWLAESVEGRKRDSLTGEGKRTHAENEARRLIKTSLKHWGICEAEMKQRKPGDRRKQQITALLRKRSLVTYDWIIQELGMGSRPSVYKAIKTVESLKGKELKEWNRLLKTSI